MEPRKHEFRTTANRAVSRTDTLPPRSRANVPLGARCSSLPFGRVWMFLTTRNRPSAQLAPKGWPKWGRNGAEFAHFSGAFCRRWIGMGLRQTWADFGRNWADFGRVGSDQFEKRGVSRPRLRSWLRGNCRRSRPLLAPAFWARAGAGGGRPGRASAWEGSGLRWARRAGRWCSASAP